MKSNLFCKAFNQVWSGFEQPNPNPGRMFKTKINKYGKASDG